MKYDPLVIELVETREQRIINPHKVMRIEQKKGSCLVTMEDDTTFHVKETMNKLCQRIDSHCGTNWSQCQAL